MSIILQLKICLEFLMESFPSVFVYSLTTLIVVHMLCQSRSYTHSPVIETIFKTLLKSKNIFLSVLRY